jgi:hypothetical protein
MNMMKDREDRNKLKVQYFADKKKLEEDGMKKEHLDTQIEINELNSRRPGRNDPLAKSQQLPKKKDDSKHVNF